MSPEERREGHWPGAGRSPMDASMAVAGQESGELPAGATNKSLMMSGRDRLTLPVKSHVVNSSAFHTVWFLLQWLHSATYRKSSHN